MVSMGLVYSQISLANPRNNNLGTLEVKALIDTGALLLCIPARVASRLQLEAIEEREVIIADGKKQSCPYVGPIELKFANRTCFAGALVLGDEVLLGAVPMEDMDLIVHPSSGKLTVNPDSPNIASAKVKSCT